MINKIIEVINEEAASQFEISVQELKSKSQKRLVVLPRQLAMACVRDVLNLSNRSIGDRYGKDHKTVSTGISTIKANPLSRNQLEILIERVNQRFEAV